MNWLIVPHTGKKNVRGESNFVLFEDMARTFIERGDVVYFAVPPWTQDADVRLPKDRCKVVRLNITGSYYVDMALMGDQLVREFNHKIGSSYVDVCITSKIFLTPYLSTSIADTQRGSFPVIYFEPGVDDKFTRLRKSGDGFNMAHFLISSGYVSSYPIFLTETERKIATRYISNYLSPSVTRDFLLKRSTVLPVGVPIDLLEEHKNTPKNEEFTLFFGGRANDVKRVADIVWLYDKFYASGRKVKIVICTSTPEVLARRYIGTDQFFQNRNIELHTDMDRASYLKLAAKSHVFLAWSRREGFPVAFWEQMYLGIVGVFVDEEWVHGNVYEVDGVKYPYIFRNKEEAYANLMEIYDNYDQAQERMVFYKNKARSFDKKNIYNQIRDLGLSLNKPWRMTSGVKSLIAEVLLKFPLGFTMRELLLAMEKSGRTFQADQEVRARTYRYPSNYDIYRYLISLGYVFEPVFYPSGTELVWRRGDDN